MTRTKPWSCFPEVPFGFDLGFDFILESGSFYFLISASGPVWTIIVPLIITSFLCKYLYLGSRMQLGNLESCQNTGYFGGINTFRQQGKKAQLKNILSTLIIPCYLQNFVDIAFGSLHEETGSLCFFSNSRGGISAVRRPAVFPLLCAVSSPWGGEKAVPPVQGCLCFTFKHIHQHSELTLEELIFRKSVSLLPFIITGNRELAVLGRGPSLVVRSVLLLRWKCLLHRLDQSKSRSPLAVLTLSFHIMVFICNLKAVSYLVIFTYCVIFKTCLFSSFKHNVDSSLIS